jgi:hypothetical protein
MPGRVSVAGATVAVPELSSFLQPSDKTHPKSAVAKRPDVIYLMMIP